MRDPLVYAMADCEYEYVESSLIGIDQNLDDKLDEIFAVAREVETRLKISDYYNLSLSSSSQRSGTPKSLSPSGHRNRPLPNVPTQVESSHSDQLYLSVDTSPKPPPRPSPSPIPPPRPPALRKGKLLPKYSFKQVRY